MVSEDGLTYLTLESEGAQSKSRIFIPEFSLVTARNDWVLKDS